MKILRIIFKTDLGLLILLPGLVIAIFVGGFLFMTRIPGGIKITQDQVIDKNWGFTFSNFSSNLQEQRGNLDNPNSKTYRNFGVVYYNIYQPRANNYVFSSDPKTNNTYELTPDMQIQERSYTGITGTKPVAYSLNPFNVEVRKISSGDRALSCMSNYDKKYIVCFYLHDDPTEKNVTNTFTFFSK